MAEFTGHYNLALPIFSSMKNYIGICSSVISASYRLCCNAVIINDGGCLVFMCDIKFNPTLITNTFVVVFCHKEHVDTWTFVSKLFSYHDSGGVFLSSPDRWFYFTYKH